MFISHVSLIEKMGDLVLQRAKQKPGPMERVLGWVLTCSLIVSLWVSLSTSLGFSHPIIILRGPD